MGAGYYRRVKETFIKSVAVSTAIATVGWFIIKFFPEVLLSIFGDNDPAMIEFACKTMRTFLGLVLVAGFYADVIALAIGVVLAAKELMALNRKIKSEEAASG